MDEHEAPEAPEAPPPAPEDLIRQLQAELEAAKEANRALKAQVDSLQPPPEPDPPAPPAVPRPPAPPAAARTEPAPQQLSGVLLVDDSKIMRLSLSRLISSFGYRIVGEADSGEFGADMAVSLQPAVVILDNTMPGMSGLECAAIIREKSPGTRIVVLTSTMDQATGVNYAAMGVTDILAKPTQTDLLLKILSKHLGPAPARQA